MLLHKAVNLDSVFVSMYCETVISANNVFIHPPSDIFPVDNLRVFASLRTKTPVSGHTLQYESVRKNTYFLLKLRIILMEWI